MDRGACWSTAHRAAQSQTQLKCLSMQEDWGRQRKAFYRHIVHVWAVNVCTGSKVLPCNVGDTAPQGKWAPENCLWNWDVLPLSIACWFQRLEIKKIEFHLVYVFQLLHLFSLSFFNVLSQDFIKCSRKAFVWGFPGVSDENPPAMWGTWVLSLGWEDPLEEETATHSSILAWRIPWTEEPDGQFV